MASNSRTIIEFSIALNTLNSESYICGLVCMSEFAVDNVSSQSRLSSN
jgi:hypothetical protein